MFTTKLYTNSRTLDTHFVSNNNNRGKRSRSLEGGRIWDEEGRGTRAKGIYTTTATTNIQKKKKKKKKKIKKKKKKRKINKW